MKESDKQRTRQGKQGTREGSGETGREGRDGQNVSRPYEGRREQASASQLA